MKIEAGSTLDMAIAEAIGLKTAVVNDQGSIFEIVVITHPEWVEVRGFKPERFEGDDVPCVPFRPSTDLNAAFVAAEKVGLFSETFWRTLGMDELGEQWCVFDSSGRRKRELTKPADTPALAICAAILKLMETKE